MRGAVSLVFDDGYTEVFEQVVPLLRKYSLRAVFAVPLDTDAVARSEHAAMTSFAQWKDLCTREGHELAAHGVHHTALTRLGDVELDHELRAAKNASDATTLVYPGGAVDERVRTATARYFSAARSTAWGIEYLPPKDRYTLRTLNATHDNFRWWKFGSRELYVILRGGWVIETFHNVTTHPKRPHDVPLHDFEWHLAWLSRLPLRKGTIRKILG